MSLPAVPSNRRRFYIEFADGRYTIEHVWEPGEPLDSGQIEGVIDDVAASFCERRIIAVESIEVARGLENTGRYVADLIVRSEALVSEVALMLGERP